MYYTFSGSSLTDEVNGEGQNKKQMKDSSQGNECLRLGGGGHEQAGPDWGSQHASDHVHQTNQDSGSHFSLSKSSERVKNLGGSQARGAGFVHPQCYRHTVLQTHSVPHRQCYSAIQC